MAVTITIIMTIHMLKHSHTIMMSLHRQEPPLSTACNNYNLAVIKARSLKIEAIYEYNDVKINVGSTAQLKAVVG
ncbi:MAG: hypothetical protein ACLVAU_13280 [Ruminococcus sp.]